MPHAVEAESSSPSVKDCRVYLLRGIEGDQEVGGKEGRTKHYLRGA